MSIMDLMQVDIPEGVHGSVAVERFEVERSSIANLHLALHGARDALPGTYTKLTRNGRLWMSDTTAERRDHHEPAHQIRQRGGRVLIGGLGLGMIVNVALRTDGVEHVDVVEIDPDVIVLVGPHYERVAQERGVGFKIHQADMYQITWPAGTRWDVAWFDIWPDLCTDNLKQMAKLRRSYGRRTGWNDCWGRHQLLRYREQEKRQPWYGY